MKWKSRAASRSPSGGSRTVESTVNTITESSINIKDLIALDVTLSVDEIHELLPSDE
jgi:hypothetical protein